MIRSGNFGLGRKIALAGLLLVFPLGEVLGETVRIIQTNSRGDNLHIIDPATHEVVGEISGSPVNHGVSVHPDGSLYYITSEAKHTVDVVDTKTLELVAEVELSGRPNNITITPDGRKLYVAIRTEPGAIDVIDTATLELMTVPTAGGMHNTYATPDGRHIIAGATGGQHMLVLDAETAEPLWRLFNQGVRPIGIETNPDGSTSRLFVQLTGLHGFSVVDFEQRREVRRVHLPYEADPGESGGGSLAPSHGIGVAPNQETLWVNSRHTDHVYVYSLPDVEYLGSVPTGRSPNWLTFTPDSRYVYVACPADNVVTVIDVNSRTEVASIEVGPNPQRNITMVFPAGYEGP